MRCVLGLGVPLVLLACTSAEDEAYSEDDLALARAAVPSVSRLESGVPTPKDNPGALSVAADSELGELSVAAATEINYPAAAMVRLLEEVVALPPTLYDSEKKEFLWGPWDNEDGVGKVLVTIRENPPGDDFDYGYVFARTMSADLAGAVPVISGGATPDPSEPDHGVGVTLWDIDANNAFDSANDPDIKVADRLEEGKIVMLYGREPTDDAEVLYNVAVLRDFRPEDAAADDAPIDSEYFYGRVADPDGTLHFIDWQFDYDLCDRGPTTCWENQTVADAQETFSLRAAFVGRAGRGEATMTGGDLSDPVSVVECWDKNLITSYFAVDDGSQILADGSCGGDEEVTLAERGVPTLADVDPALLDAMECVAEEGVWPCE